MIWTGIWASLAVLVAYGVGAMPFSNWVAEALTKTDLRQLEGGTVSGTGLYRVAGFFPLAVGGLLDVGKGALGPLLADKVWAEDRWLLVAFAGAAAVAGHNWSVLLWGAGGRGISPALGAFSVIAWPASLYLLGALALGRLLHHTGLAVFVALPTLPLFLLWINGSQAAIAAAVIALPMIAKRVLGNTPLPAYNRLRAAAHRLVFDNDHWPVQPSPKR
ncbi:MAG: glycerol-3-phosphate acyltransferase [bacterium]|nr:glycerol-3-phosphate acyltransferase [bacterium]